MKKKIVASILSVAICASMLGTTCFAAATDKTLTGDSTETDKTITGDSEVKSPIYSVVVPTTVEFGIDAFEQAGQTNSQIASAELPIYNKSNVAVRVQADIKVEPKDDTVTLVDSASEVTETDTSKNLFIGLEIPKKVDLKLGTAADATGADATAMASYTKHSDGKLYLTTGLTSEDTDAGGAFNGEGAAAAADIQAQAITGNTIDYPAGTESDPQYIIALGADEVSVAFALDKAAYYKVYSKSSDGTGTDKFYKAASATDGGTVFRLTGTVNSRAPWAASDVKASVTYSFLGIRGANYKTQSAATSGDSIAYVDGTAKLLKESTGPVFTPSATPGIVTYTAGEGKDALVSITSIKWQIADGSQAEIIDYITHDATAKTLTLNEGTRNYWADTVSEKEATITYKLADDTTKEVKVKFKIK